MRLVSFLAALALGGGCSRPATPSSTAPSAAAPAARAPVAALELADPGAARQLVSGFYELEEGRFRWTARHFVATLGTPPSAARRGATLRLQAFVPAGVLAQAPEVTLRCLVDGVPVPPELVRRTGPLTVARDVPPLAGAGTTLDCTLDHAIPPGPVDKRELGIVLTRLALEER